MLSLLLSLLLSPPLPPMPLRRCQRSLTAAVSPFPPHFCCPPWLRMPPLHRCRPPRHAVAATNVERSLPRRPLQRMPTRRCAATIRRCRLVAERRPCPRLPTRRHLVAARPPPPTPVNELPPPYRRMSPTPIGASLPAFATARCSCQRLAAVDRPRRLAAASTLRAFPHRNTFPLPTPADASPLQRCRRCRLLADAQLPRHHRSPSPQRRCALPSPRPTADARQRPPPPAAGYLPCRHC